MHRPMIIVCVKVQKIRHRAEPGPVDAVANCGAREDSTRIGSGGVVLKQSGFSINVQPPLATAIQEEVELISNHISY